MQGENTVPDALVVGGVECNIDWAPKALGVIADCDAFDASLSS